MEKEAVNELFRSFLINYQVDQKNNIWKIQSSNFIKFWDERIMKAGPELTDQEIDDIVRILDSHGKGNTKESEAVAGVMIPQGAWKRMFHQLRSDKTIANCIDLILKTNSSEEKIRQIDKLFELNQSVIGHLTGKSGNAINCLLAAYDPFNNSSIVSLKDRYKFLKSLGIEYDYTNESIGTQIEKTNSLIKTSFEGSNIQANARTITYFAYHSPFRDYWKPEELEIPEPPKSGPDDAHNIRYWIYAPGRNAQFWDTFYREGVMGLGWNEAGNFRNFASRESMVEKMKEQIDPTKSFSNDSLACWQFYKVIKPGDLIFVKKGVKAFIGYGIVNSDYYYDPTRTDYHHLRKVKWIKRGEWIQESGNIVLKTLTDVTRYQDYVQRLTKLIGIEKTSISVKSIWIEKTLVRGRIDRNEGERSVGLALWSPQTDKRGADIYKNMRDVEVEDIVLHLTDNEDFSGISIVEERVISANGLENTEWSGPAYLIKLKKYLKLPHPINKGEVLNEHNKVILEKIAKDSEVFYTNDLKLRQGAYLTPCPIELLSLINISYFKMVNSNLPYVGEFLARDINKSNMDLDLELSFKEISHSGFQFNNKLLVRFIGSLLTKPFVILTGLSGSGKTKLAQVFAKWICETDDQICLVPVGADWTNREPLLGFPSALEKGRYILPDNGVLSLIMEASKEENQNKPYILILDEMNLSHVERYFADFLSAMESNELIPLHPETSEWMNNKGVPASIALPKNLFMIGTVNVDETTYMFSPKVLDRASVIEFSVSHDEMNDYLKKSGSLDLDSIKGWGSKMAKNFLKLSWNKEISLRNKDEITNSLIKFFSELKKVGAEFGYRSASEILRLSEIIKKIEPVWGTNEIIDISIMQKLLPKVHGSRRKLEPVLRTLAGLCLKEEFKNGNGFKIENLLNSEELTIAIENMFYPVSFEKIKRMYRRLIDNGFTSYAEA